MLFNLSGFSTFTNYCIQASGDYVTEITPGIGKVQVTACKCMHMNVHAIRHVAVTSRKQTLA